MWAYVVYLAVDTNIYGIFGMLVPWVLVFGYLKSSSKWDYAAVVAAFTPAIITLGRLPYKDVLPPGDYAILRIEENLVGIAIASVLTIVIFPIFASDLLRSNIQSNYFPPYSFKKKFSFFFIYSKQLFSFVVKLAMPCVQFIIDYFIMRIPIRQLMMMWR